MCSLCRSFSTCCSILLDSAKVRCEIAAARRCSVDFAGVQCDAGCGLRSVRCFDGCAVGRLRSRRRLCVMSSVAPPVVRRRISASAPFRRSSPIFSQFVFSDFLVARRSWRLGVARHSVGHALPHTVSSGDKRTVASVRMSAVLVLRG